MIPFRAVRATKGKAIRAEPVAALYEQGRVHHVGGALGFAILEDQLTSWTPDSGESPDRLDALVWGITALGLTATDWSDGGFAPVGFGKRNEFDFGGLR
jgi:phage terminase large subunit-like protein